MTNNESSRLDRIEAILERLLEREESNAYAIESNARAIASNARAIEALTAAVGELRRDRSELYELMAESTRKQAQVFENQARTYRILEGLNDRQQTLTEIVRVLANRANN